MTELTALQRRNLKAHAHHLTPVVMIGNDGLTDAVLAAIDAQLVSHELIKVRVFSDDRTARGEMAAKIGAALNTGLVQHIGKLLVLYRPAAEGAKIDSLQPYVAPQPGQSPAKKAPAKPKVHVSKKLSAAGKTAPKKRPRKTVAEPAEDTQRPSRIAQEYRKGLQRATRRGARRSR